MHSDAAHMRFHKGTIHLEPRSARVDSGSLPKSSRGSLAHRSISSGRRRSWRSGSAANAVGIVEFDVYPFILLNLAFSLQAAYAAPLILLAETRQAERDKMWTAADAEHREAIGTSTLTMLQQNTELTQRVAELSERVERLTQEIHARVVEKA